MKEFRTKNELVVQSSDGVFVAYDAVKGDILELNEVGFRVVRACASPNTVGGVCGELEQECTDLPPRCELEKDVYNFLIELENCGFVTGQFVSS
jgi:hypothetical protein